MGHLARRVADASAGGAEAVFALGVRVRVAVPSSVPGLDAAQRGVRVVRGLEGGLGALDARVGRREVILLFPQLLPIAANDDARICKR